MHDLLIILFALLGGTGATMIFIGHSFSIITTAGINRYWGLASIFIPFVSVFFCLMHAEEASYPLKLMGIGLAIVAATLLLAYGLSFHSW